MTISLPAGLVERLERKVRDGRRVSRSAAIAGALEEYYARRADDLVREETIRYYDALNAREATEDAALARASLRALAAALEAGERAPFSARRGTRRRGGR